MKKFGGSAHDLTTDKDRPCDLARRDFLQQAAAVGAGAATSPTIGAHKNCSSSVGPRSIPEFVCRRISGREPWLVPSFGWGTSASASAFPRLPGKRT